MDDNKEIFLPDTTVKYKVLKEKLEENYGLSLMTKKSKYIYVGSILILGAFLIYKTLKK